VATIATVQDVRTRLAGLARMSYLTPDEFAEEGGLADVVARELGNNLKPTQLRKVFTEIKRVRVQVTKAQPGAPFERASLLKLMPTLAYAVGRKLLPEEFYEILKLILGRQRVQTNADFVRTADFVEAVLAYHKYRNA